MNASRRIRTLALLCSVLAPMLLASCEADKKPTRPVDTTYLPQTSAGNVLANLRAAYIHRNADAYVRLFSNDFVFVFNPLDVENPQNPTPPQWGLDDERDSARNMFQSDAVDKIELSFVNGVPVESNDEYPNTWKVDMTDINLQLDTRANDGSPLKQIVTSGHCVFYFKTYPDEPVEGTPMWRIVRWEDKGFGTALSGRPVQSSSWGGIKSVYSPAP